MEKWVEKRGEPAVGHGHNGPQWGREHNTMVILHSSVEDKKERQAYSNKMRYKKEDREDSADTMESRGQPTSAQQRSQAVQDKKSPCPSRLPSSLALRYILRQKDQKTAQARGGTATASLFAGRDETGGGGLGRQGKACCRQSRKYAAALASPLSWKGAEAPFFPLCCFRTSLESWNPPPGSLGQVAPSP